MREIIIRTKGFGELTFKNAEIFVDGVQLHYVKSVDVVTDCDKGSLAIKIVHCLEDDKFKEEVIKNES